MTLAACLLPLLLWTVPSADCLPCHTLAQTHPEPLYPQAAPGLVPLSRLDPRVVLSDGRMVCTTCHAATGLRFQLFDAPTRVCLTCHDFGAL
jgi:hypothetical protein